MGHYSKYSRGDYNVVYLYIWNISLSKRLSEKICDICIPYWLPFCNYYADDY